MLKSVWLILFVFVVNANEPALHYLSIRPQASIQREGAFVRIAANVGTNVSWTAEAAAHPAGPWHACGLVAEINSTNQFFRVAVNTNQVTFDLGFTYGTASLSF